jgi:nitrite reductase/ring-hydroxylating ferredoxin subunit/uncharacterized membrane protein
MSDDPILAFAERQEWLAPLQEKTEAAVKNIYGSAGEAGQAVKNALHGVWLGHPLHSAITDVPIGSWTATAVLDAMEAAGEKKYAPGADASLLVGLAGAVASAASGLTDWSDVHGKPQRVGALHGLLNAGATALYVASCIARKTRRRGLGRALAFAGYGVVMASAYLGGAISYRQRIGVDHAPNADEDLPREFAPFEPALRDSDLNEGQPVKAKVQGTDVLLLKRDGKIFALANACAHLGGPLNEGTVEGDTVTCPWHGSKFCLRTGRVINGPAVHPQPTLEVMTQDGRLFAKTSSETREKSGY